MLNITNNKKTSLLKSEIIINIDFSEELINKYKIFNRAIIVNILDKINIYKNNFNGVNINYYRIYMPNKYKVLEFDDEIIYESLIYQYKELSTIRQKIREDKISIKEFIGNNGLIQESELN